MWLPETVLGEHGGGGRIVCSPHGFRQLLQFVYDFLFEAVPYVAQADLGLTTYPRVTLKS